MGIASNIGHAAVCVKGVASARARTIGIGDDHSLIQLYVQAWTAGDKQMISSTVQASPRIWSR
jgi:hypothetical protein